MIDGFPKNMEQAQLFEKKYGQIQNVIYFEANEEELI